MITNRPMDVYVVAGDYATGDIDYAVVPARSVEDAVAGFYALANSELMLDSLIGAGALVDRMDWRGQLSIELDVTLTLQVSGWQTCDGETPLDIYIVVTGDQD